MVGEGGLEVAVNYDYLGRRVEHILYPVAMMYIPVNDEDSVYCMIFACILCGDGGVVKEAESTSFVAFSMMSRRSNYCYSPFRFFIADSINYLKSN